MIHLVRVQFESAHFEPFLFRVTGVILGLSSARDHYLYVGLHTLCSGVNQGFGLKYTFFVNEVSSFDIIYSIKDYVKWVPESIILNIFSVFGHNLPLSGQIQIRVDLGSFPACNFTFEFGYICISKQKLSVEIANFNTIIISAVYTATFRS